MPQDRFEQTIQDLHASLVRTVHRFEDDRGITGDHDAYIRQHSYDAEEVIAELVMFRFGIMPDDLDMVSQDFS